MKGSEAQKQRPHKLLWMLWFDEKSVSSILTYYIENRCFLILITFRIFKVFSSEVLIILQDTLGQNEKFCNLPLTWPLQKKKITENATRYYSYFSRGQNSIFWWMQHVYICWGFFFGWVCLFLRIEKSMKQKRREKKKFCTKIPAANVLRNLIFWGYLFTFRAACLIKNPPFRLSIDL